MTTALPIVTPVATPVSELMATTAVLLEVQVCVVPLRLTFAPGVMASAVVPPRMTVVSAGVIILRRTRPDLPRAFRTPLVPVLPILSVLSCFYLMLNLPVETWLRFLIWMVIGAVLYFTYGFRHSRVTARQTP